MAKPTKSNKFENRFKIIKLGWKQSTGSPGSEHCLNKFNNSIQIFQHCCKQSRGQPNPVTPPSPPCASLLCTPPLVRCLLQGRCATLGVGTATAPAPHPSACSLILLSPPTPHPSACPLLLVPTHLHANSAVTHTHMHLASPMFLIGLSPIRTSSCVGANVREPRGFLPRWWLASHSASLVFWVVGWDCVCLVLFAARLSVFCVPCLSCVISAHCACSGPTVNGLLGAANLRWGWGRTPTLPPCAYMLLPGILVACSSRSPRGAGAAGAACR